jgi:hypothetical protein
MTIKGRPHKLKSAETIRAANEQAYKRLGELMGTQLIPKWALGQMLLDAPVARSRAYAYVKIKEYLAKGFIKEPYKLHYVYDIYWSSPTLDLNREKHILRGED